MKHVTKFLGMENKRPIKYKCFTLTILCTGSKWNVIYNLEWVTIKQARVLKGDHQTSQKLVQKLVWIGEFLDGDLPLITAYWTSAIIEGRLRGLSQVIRANPCQGGMRTSTTFGPGRGAVARSASVNPSNMTFIFIVHVKFNLIFNVCTILLTQSW